MKSIDVLPFGGLGNRMRVINSAISLSKSRGIEELNLIWLVKSELTADFYSLFKSVGIHLKLVQGIKLWLFLNFVKHIYIVKYERIYRFFLNLFYTKVFFDSDIRASSPGEILKNIKDSDQVIFATCLEFFPFSNFDNFIPSESVSGQLTKLELPDRYVGVHIRRKDHHEIISESDIKSYIHQIRLLLENNPQLIIFLASDDETVKHDIRRIFPGKVKSQEISLERDNEQAIQGAWVDILILSGAEVIICNRKSSFSETAIRIGKPKKIINV